MDEIGFSMRRSQKESVIFDRRIGSSKSISSGTTAWVSVLKCINAAEADIKPLVIHREKLSNTPLNRWFPPSEECPDWFYGFTEKGWISTDYALLWLTEIFLSQTDRETG